MHERGRNSCNQYPRMEVIMVQSLGLGRRLGRHRDGSVSATRIGLGRYAKNAT